jgi:hypothetical protein
MKTALKNFSSEIKMFIQEFSNELVAQNVAIFAGAGLSKPAGYVDWKNLLKTVTQELGLNPDTESDLVAIAQYHCNENGNNRSVISQTLVNEFSSNLNITENHMILSRLPINTYWTTNYDKLIERSISDSGKIADVKYTINQLAITVPRRDVVVYKMHGDIDHPADAVIIKDDYENYHIKRGAFIENLSGDLISKTFLFIGFSFTDPNLDYILGRIRSRYTNHMRRHYCFIKEINRFDCGSDEEFEYKKRKQILFIGDLKRFNIKSIMIESYQQITEILKEIERIHRAKTIFISGSANLYGKWGRDKSEIFIRKLSSEIIMRKLRIVSGFGLGIGSSVIAGALEKIYLDLRESNSERLILRPFPQPQQGFDHEHLWEKYRNEMCKLSGIAIFMFGNKIDESGIKLADGVMKEFKISREVDVFPIPIGSTGYMAKQIWHEVERDFDAIFPIHATQIRSDFDFIGNEENSPDEIVAATLRIIDRLTRLR